MKTNKLRRLLGIVIAAVMVFAMVPAMAMAEDNTDEKNEVISYEDDVEKEETDENEIVTDEVKNEIDEEEPAGGLRNGGGEPSSELTVVDMLTISDPIAPINGEAPKTAIAETEQYTGTIEWLGEEWQGEPETFYAGCQYTATIRLTAKEGYTFEGVEADSFEVPSAASCSNAANSGVITAAFFSPWNGYVTDGNGLAAYRIYSGYDNGYVDIINTFNGRWVSTTYDNGGYGVIYKIGNGENKNLSAIGEEVDIGEELTMKVEPSFSDGGLFVNLKYTVRNTGTEDKVISFGGHADIQIAGDDRAPITKFADGRGFRMVNQNNGCEFKFFGKGTLGVTDVDTFWFGSYSSRYDNIFTQVEAESYSGDSGMAYSWKDRTIPADKTRVFSLVMGAGDAQAGENIIGVNFEPQNGSDIISVQVDTAGDTITPPADPEYEGYIFGGWYTEPNCENEFDFDTPITETITLYAKWIKSYTITFNANGGTVSPASAATNKDGEIEGELPEPEYSGYTFDGWFTAAEGGDKVTADTVFTDDTIIYAQWTKNAAEKFVITFDAGEGAVEPETAETNAEGKLDKLPTPTLSGYTFKGWFTEENGGDKVTTSTVFTEDTTIYAQWTKKTTGGGASGTVSFVLTYNTNGGSEIKAESHKVGDEVTLDKTPVKDGYTFTGWYADKECTQKIESVTMNSSKTVYAGWSDGTQPVKPDENAPLMVIRIGDTKYQLNGVDKEMDSAPFIDENDRTMLPVRVVANALGISDADIAWDNTTKTASFTRPDGKVVSCTVGSNIIKIGDEEVEIDTAPVIRNDRIYLPMRALFNAFNVSDAHIIWDGVNKTVTVTKEALDDIKALEAEPVEEPAEEAEETAEETEETADNPEENAETAE